jgi:hypothetical protein
MLMNDANSNNKAPPMTVVINGEAHLEYYRDKPLPADQRAFLDRMDEQMSAGVRLGGEEVSQPGALQRAQFVAIQVIEALQSGNDALIAAGCAYLASRLPDLTQVKARLVDGGFSAELVFNQPFVKEVAVDFPPRRLS